MKITQRMFNESFSKINSTYNHNLSEKDLDNPYVRSWFVGALEILYDIKRSDNIPTEEEIKSWKEK